MWRSAPAKTHQIVPSVRARFGRDLQAALALGSEALAGSFSSLGRLDLSVLRRGVSHELIEQARCGERDLVDSAIEGLGVGL